MLVCLHVSSYRGRKEPDLPMKRGGVMGRAKSEKQIFTKMGSFFSCLLLFGLYHHHLIVAIIIIIPEIIKGRLVFL